MRLDFSGVPVLESDRLVLRQFAFEDFDAYAQLWAEPSVVEHISGTVFTRSQSWSRLMGLLGSWPLLGFGYWAVIDKASGRFAGQVGFADFQRELEPSIAGMPEAGWVIAPWAQGRGFATEAMGAALAWGLPRFGATKPVCMMDPDYAPTVRVARKSGFIDWTRTSFGGEPCLLMVHQGHI